MESSNNKPANTSTDEDWEKDKFEDGASKLVGNLHMEKMRVFVTQYSEQIREFEKALSQNLSNGWNPIYDPLTLNLTPYEQTSILELVKTKSKPLTKITLVFSYLCEEISNLKNAAESNFYAPIILFGSTKSGEMPLEGDIQIQQGRMFPFLLDLTNYVDRCKAVTLNLVRQLANLYHPQQKEYENLKFTTMWKYLSQLFEVMITLDSIIASNKFLIESWGRFQRMIKTVKKDPATYGAPSEQPLLQFEMLMHRIKGTLMDGKIFEQCIVQDFDDVSRFKVQSNPVFKKVFLSTIISYYKGLGTKEDSGDAKRFIRLCALFVFYCTLFKESDKKLLKDIWDLNKHIPIVHLFGNVTWDGCEFLTTHLSSKLQGMKVLDGKKREHLENLRKIFPLKVREYYFRVSKWIINMESDLDKLNLKPQMINKGLLYGQAISELLKNYLYLHFTTRSPIDPTKLPSIFQCFELLKSIQFQYHRRLPLIAEAATFISKKICYQMYSMLEPALQALSAELSNKKKSNVASLDARAAVTLAMQMLNGPPTRARGIIFQLAYHQVPPGLIDGGEEEIATRLTLLDSLANLGTYLNRTCDCTMLYWASDFLPLYLKYIYENPFQASKLPFLFGALGDTIHLFHKAVHVPPMVLIEDLQKEIEKLLKDEIVIPLCHEIHKDLAESIHYGTKNLDVFRQLEKGPFGQKDFSPFLRQKPLRYYNTYFDINFMVTHFLDRTFYNLNTVALYNWATFGEMRSLAMERYGLDLKEVHLPGQTLEQGADVLVIMRQLPAFVSKYRYNLNNQIFIEVSSENNTLDAITVMHIANSIRTHGTGIMNTAVSVTFQYLKEKFHLFSQFLYDEMIKSKLFRDAHAFNEQKKETKDVTMPYPYQNAKKLQDYIRGLGGTKEKKTNYLDKFRILITEIGNAMGYVRMIRSGGLLYTSNAIQFVPDLNEIEKFEELARSSNLPLHTIQAAHNLDVVVDTFYQNFSEGSEYFKMLVNVFATEYRRPENSHLENFYLIVPALTLEFIQQSSIDKEKYKSKSKEQGIFTDDGFALGIAYILKLLNQNKAFDSLLWFNSAMDFFNNELEAKTRDKENIKITQLTKAKIITDLEELKVLQWSFGSARILFHD